MKKYKLYVETGMWTIARKTVAPAVNKLGTDRPNK